MSGGDLTVAAIKKASGQYDLELVRRLHVPNARLVKVANLEFCVNLTALSLCGNRIVNVDGLESCLALLRLDLSRNCIRKVEGGLAKQRSLEHLDLHGNSILNSRQLAKDLEPCAASLASLCLASADEAHRNPCCDDDHYRKTLLAALPRLEVLDGSRVALQREVDALNEELENLAPDAEANRGPPPPPDEWISKNFDWGSAEKMPPQLKAAYAQRDAAADALEAAALDVTTDARHLAQDMDAELEKSRALLAELFPEDADPLGLGDS